MNRVKAFLMLGALVATGCGGMQNRTITMKPNGAEEQQRIEGALQPGASPLELGLRIVNDRAEGASRCASPVSLMAALDMAREGAQGETRKELDAFLSNPLVLENRKLDKIGDGALLVANALWSDEGLRPSDEYVNVLRSQLGARADVLPLRSEPSKAADAINGWVKENTKGMIEKLVEAGDVEGASVVLTNALYFRGVWASPFPSSNTETALFHSSRGDYDVPMMYQEGEFRYAENENVQMVEMAYGEEDYRMLVVLPRGVAGEVKWDSISPAVIMNLYEELEDARVKLFIPRYDSRNTLHLVSLLQRLGLENSTSAAADFSGMGSGFAGEQIGDVIQAARFTVDEQKTEAAAATAVVMLRAALIPENVTFRADRPFLYVVYYKTPLNAIFVGIQDGK